MARRGEAVDESRPLLPANRAFVVQFRREADVEQGQFKGRVEHMVSGQVTHFQSSDELLAFLVRILSSVRAAKPEET